MQKYGEKSLYQQSMSEIQSFSLPTHFLPGIGNVSRGFVVSRVNWKIAQTQLALWPGCMQDCRVDRYNIVMQYSWYCHSYPELKEQFSTYNITTVLFVLLFQRGNPDAGSEPSGASLAAKVPIYLSFSFLSSSSAQSE
jgi:hypothetical protein